MKKLFVIGLIIFSVKALSQEPKGDRVLAFQIDMSENMNYDSAFAYAENACMESIHQFSTWADIDTNGGNFDMSYVNGVLDLINYYYPLKGVKIEYQLAPLNTNVSTMPSDLIGMSFDNPIVIDRFKQTLDTVFTHLNDVEFSAFNIGNEHDVIMGSDTAKYVAYKVFLDSVIPYAKQLYFDLHGIELKVGTTFTMEGLTHPTKGPLCQLVNEGLDIITTTYYPQTMPGGDASYATILSHMDELISFYPDPIQPIFFAECGYASSPYLGSSEIIQANFFSDMFTVWDDYQDRIKYLTIFKTTDWSDDNVAELALYYGISDSSFTEFLRTLGVRKWDGDGTNKLAYDRILCELYVRDWCTVSCASVSVTENESPLSIFPNPSSGLLKIEGELIARIQVINSLGKNIATFYNTNELNLTAFPPGIYFLEMETVNGKNEVKKIVLN